jgi:hypothetical protein
VTITPNSNDTGAATVSAAMTFTSANWSTPQTVTVTGMNYFHAHHHFYPIGSNVHKQHYPFLKLPLVLPQLLRLRVSLLSC